MAIKAAARFAHLLGLGAAPATLEEPPVKPVLEPAPAAATAAPAAAAKPAAEEEQDGERMENESDEDYEKRTSKKARKSAKKAEEPKDDDDAEMHGAGPVVEARDRERERCAAILDHPNAGANLSTALTFAFDTRMTRRQAMAALDKLPASQAAFAAPKPAAANTSRSQLAERLAAEPIPVVRPAPEGPASDTAEARAAACFAAVDAIRGK